MRLKKTILEVEQSRGVSSAVADCLQLMKIICIFQFFSLRLTFVCLFHQHVKPSQMVFMG